MSTDKNVYTTIKLIITILLLVSPFFFLGLILMWAWGFFGQTVRIVITGIYGLFVLFVIISLATLPQPSSNQKESSSERESFCMDDSKDKNVLPCTSSSSFSSSWSSLSSSRSSS